MDYGDILVDSLKVKKRQFRLMRLFGADLREDEAKARWDNIKVKVHRGELSGKVGFKMFLQNIIGDKTPIYLRFLKKFRAVYVDPPVYPGAGRFLRTLKSKGARLVIVSDTGEERASLLRSLGPASKYIDAIYTSKDYGLVKGRGLLRRVLEHEKLRPAFFVCHDDDEAEEAEELGMSVVTIRNGSELDRACEAILDKVGLP